ncbi:hypothetical protein G7K_5329-t1 [Saitoella complicata NRRL Y-17804]|uniref:Uncharacterized protein n=1 Tax=Saitoella complicata (strain BCRC 22490 / CBS 7301 / JCM 7358 / NBRC 10748 / NRRL Y-17804) TaxID=698492 RepID=A0A0E9NNE7_SAICN|nr:hypothetical protein G7K_5329-t1 [Saitoella complicata NRRL Y-17804]
MLTTAVTPDLEALGREIEESLMCIFRNGKYKLHGMHTLESRFLQIFSSSTEDFLNMNCDMTGEPATARRSSVQGTLDVHTYFDPSGLPRYSIDRPPAYDADVEDLNANLQGIKKGVIRLLTLLSRILASVSFAVQRLRRHMHAGWVNGEERPHQPLPSFSHELAGVVAFLIILPFLVLVKLPVKIAVIAICKVFRALSRPIFDGLNLRETLKSWAKSPFTAMSDLINTAMGSNEPTTPPLEPQHGSVLPPPRRGIRATQMRRQVVIPVTLCEPSPADYERFFQLLDRLAMAYDNNEASEECGVFALLAWYFSAVVTMFDIAVDGRSILAKPPMGLICLAVTELCQNRQGAAGDDLIKWFVTLRKRSMVERLEQQGYL